MVSPITSVLANISIVVIVLVVLFVVVDVLLRRLFNAPITGATELSELAFSMIVFLPLAWCALKDGHVELTFVVNKLPKTTRSGIEAVMMFLTTIILGLMSWQILVQGTKLQASHAVTSVLEIPTPPFLYLATFGSIMLALAFLIKFIRSLSNIMEKQR